MTTSWGTRINKLTVPAWVRAYLRMVAVIAVSVALTIIVRPALAARAFPALTEQLPALYLIAVILCSVGAGNFMVATGAPNSIAPYLAGHLVRSGGAFLVLLLTAVTDALTVTSIGAIIIALLAADTAFAFFAWLRTRRLPQ